VGSNPTPAASKPSRRKICCPSGLRGVDAAGHEAIVTDVVRELTRRTPRSLSDFAGDHADVLARLAPTVA
jgi:hypothetical protein